MIIGFRKIKVITGELGPCCDWTLTLLKRKTTQKSKKILSWPYNLLASRLCIPTYVLGIRNEKPFIYVVLLVLGFPQRPMLKYIHNLDGKFRTQPLCVHTRWTGNQTFFLKEYMLENFQFHACMRNFLIKTCLLRSLSSGCLISSAFKVPT